MSCYEWERGTIQFSAKEWPGFRKLMIRVWNEHQEKIHEVAKKAHLAAKAAAKGKRGANRQPLVLAAIAQECGGYMDDHEFQPGKKYDGWGSYSVNDEAQELWGAVTSLILCGKIWKNEATDTKNPQKKNLKIYPVSKGCTISYGECSVTFDNESRSLSWYVDENNHSRYRAHEHWYTKRLFHELNQVTWTRGTGGKIIGNDEYNRDADYEGGGGNYVTHSFGPLGEREVLHW